MKRFLLCLSFFLSLLAAPVWAITFDAFSTGEGSNSSTHNHPFAGNANACIICLAMRESTGSVQAASGVTVNGVPATFVDGISNSGGVIRVEMWRLLAPPTGTQQVIATAHASTDILVTGVMSFIDVAQSGTFNTPKTAVNQTVNQSDIDTLLSALGELGVYCGAGRTAGGVAETVVPDAGSPASTEQYDIEHSALGSAVRGFGYTEDGAATSINMRVDYSAGASTQWAGVAVSMRPLSSGGMKAHKPVRF